MERESLWDLYWLAYLLTGERDRSIHAVVETMEMEWFANRFFKKWFTTWSRKIFVARVLGRAIPETSKAELRSRLDELQADSEDVRSRPAWAGAGKPELEAALLAIDPFPRRALLLTAFEKLSVEDAGILLNADRESIKLAAAIGMIELARKLAAHAAPHDSNVEPAGALALTA